MSERSDPYAFLPPIRRARGWRLYARDGRRFLDLWQDGGRSVLGAKPARLATEIKALVDRGLDRGLPSTELERLGREIRRRWPGYAAYRVFRSEEGALAALASVRDAAAGGAPRGAEGRAEAGAGLRDLVLDETAFLRDPARRRPLAPPPGAGEGLEEALLLRPFAAYLATDGAAGGAGEAPAGRRRFALPLLPCPRAFALGLVLALDEAAAAALPPSDLVSPLAAHAALQALHALDRYEAEVGEETWRRADRRLRAAFERRGPYLFPRDPAGWEAKAARALEAGVVLPLDPDLPATLPGDFDDGELAALASALGAPSTR